MLDFVELLEEFNLVEVAPVKKRVNKTVRRKRHVEYLKKKAKKKMMAKKYRKSSKFKKWKVKTKVKSKTGRTATGRRKVKFVGL